MSHDAHCEYFRQLVIVLSMKKVYRWKSFEKKCICRDVFQAINVKSSREILLLMVLALGLVGGETKVSQFICLPFRDHAKGTTLKQKFVLQS